ncbi:MAG: cytochrome c biogenesis protein CcsA [Coriobacteriales bacterium]|jgi:cytochrome c-type biogenesis protein CcmF|nr:cytochrome c biogenesis protein CcsA [Coriobacteriales bacterium]
MALLGQILQILALLTAAVAVVLLMAGRVMENGARRAQTAVAAADAEVLDGDALPNGFGVGSWPVVGTSSKEGAPVEDAPARIHGFINAWAEQLTNGGYLLTMGTAVLLTLCVGIILFALFTNNFSLEYVARNHSDGGWLYKLAGLWGGRQGSLLFWGWLISLFTTWVAYKRMRVTDDLSNMAVMVAQLVLAAFVGVLVFSTSNNPFIAINPQYLDAQGGLTGPAAAWGMNLLLEHWAMAIHPPTLFVGYAGFTIPFAYALAALIVNDPSKRWVELCTRVTVLSWFMLGVGIGLGAVWAYVVLGWGGYWGWDAVENASLLPWLVGVALLHTFTVYRKRGAFKRWGILGACVAFAFVILGTFITRSGIVQSVHAFEGDPVSLVLFLVLIGASLLAGIVGLALRWRSFASNDELSSFISKDAAYYFNNAIMVIAAILLAYMTISSALPQWLWFGGQTLNAGVYNSLARPVGVLYCLILAVCPLLGWGRTEGREFLRKIRIPGLCAVVVFAALMWFFFADLLPIYNATIAAGGAAAEDLMAYGPAWYYNGLAIVAFAVASLIVCNTLFLFTRGANERKRNLGEGFLRALVNIFRKAPVQVGGYLSHLGIALCLIGLVGSSMYVSETRVAVPEVEGSTFTVERYTLEYAGYTNETLPNGDEVLSTHFKVYGESGWYLGTVSPGAQFSNATQQQKLLAGTLGAPTRDLFVVFNGLDTNDNLSIDAKVNPFISFVWVGFAFLIAGPLIAALARRRFSVDQEAAEEEANVAGDVAGDALGDADVVEDAGSIEEDADKPEAPQA